MARLLLVEDDLLQQSILKSALEQHGYEIETASDGLTAISKLCAGGYDLALMDYQLPEVDGLASARLIQEVVPQANLPKLIAMTGAVDDLCRHDADARVFDAILPKPLALPAVLSMVDHQLRSTKAGQIVIAATESWIRFGLAHRPSVLVVPTPAPDQAQVLRCYFDLSERHPPEAVLLITPEARDAATMIRQNSPYFSLPFIDLSGSHTGADAAFAMMNHETWRATAHTILSFCERRQDLRHDVLGSTDLGTRLLVYMYLSGKSFHPTLDYSSRECLRYPGLFLSGDIRTVAEDLANRGLLERRFFERFHVCGGCGSSRLNVREECPACQSSQLDKASFIHHLRCDYQGLEPEFTQGSSHLTCPKCHKNLHQQASDYKLEVAIICECCGVISPEPEIGLLCIDCGARTPANVSTARNAFSYTLTPKALTILRQAPLQLVPPATSTAPLPSDLIKKLAQCASHMASIIKIEYQSRQQILQNSGETIFLAMRKIFLENLINALDMHCILEVTQDYDYLAIDETPTIIQAILTPEFLDDCQHVLSERITPTIQFMETPAV